MTWEPKNKLDDEDVDVSSACQPLEDVLYCIRGNAMINKMAALID